MSTNIDKSLADVRVAKFLCDDCVTFQHRLSLLVPRISVEALAVLLPKRRS